MYETEEKQERALLVCLDTGEYDAESSLAELSELVKSAGADPAFTLAQKRPAPDTATCVGSGMAQEVAELCRKEELDLVIFDRELSPTQIRNLEKLCSIRVIDRTMLILDIFALRAQSREGKLQVELAQLKYLLPRLTGQGTALSRLGAGIGTRGPGETKLETDRRHIRRRINSLREQLKGVEAARSEINRRRKKDGTITVALVGYTNAGKSTLMNQLTQAGVLAEDKLFATLDPTARALKLPCGKTVMLIDTVGLLRRLPHHLVEAFKSTLEQAATADIILNVCDASSEEAGEHLAVTNELLQEKVDAQLRRQVEATVRQMAEKALENRGAKAEKITVTMDTSEDGGIYIQQVTIYLDKQNKPKALAAREVLEQQLGVSVVLDATG